MAATPLIVPPEWVKRRSMELLSNVGDGRGPAAAWTFAVTTSIPSLNFTPKITFDNWFWPSRRRQLFSAAWAILKIRASARPPAPATSPTRRRFIQGAAAATAGLTIGFHWAGNSRAAAATNDVLAPNAFVRVAPDNTVTVIIKHVEMGQGTYTGLATVVAEELDADWSQVRAEAAPADASRYNNLFFGKIQGTGGSTARANSWDQLRQAGATARAMLVAAAATEWRVPASEITVERGVVKHAASGRSAKFGALAAKAAAQPVPANVALKDPKDFHLIGHRVPRLDTHAKTDGTAQFALDVRLPDMVIAVVQRPPLFGATVRSLDPAAAKAVAGVVDVVQIPAGVAVVGKNFWAAKQGRDALKIEWDDRAAEKRST